MILRGYRLLLTFVALFFPVIVFADSTESMSFTPPASDISVVFLGNIFGLVDGVLHGSGSQMMGILFSVFNSAVLALGGIVMMYIILVSTMNTAHEGQMLGQKWSSIWVPVRATAGLALLIPKTSGYCLMQIFVMWVVVQGVGVADKVWGTALDYLNRGGVIMQAQIDPAASMAAGGTGPNSVITGAGTILYGQVCMVALQTQLENQHKFDLDAKDENSGPCSGTPSPTVMQKFCDQTVPDFIGSVDPLDAYAQQTPGLQSAGGGNYSIPMPNFEADSVYASLNGVCGTLVWAMMDVSTLTTMNEEASSGEWTVSESDIETVSQSRAAAVEQMYISLSSTAKSIVSNDPQINPNGGDPEDYASVVADYQFGLSQTESGSACPNLNADCPYWGKLEGSAPSLLLDGTELQDAVTDYNAVMQPALKLLSDAQDHESASAARAFIDESKRSGWILAGSYFFQLVQLNGSVSASSSNTDANSKLGSSSFDLNNLTGMINCDTDAPSDLCYFLSGSGTRVDQIVDLFTGAGDVDVQKPDLTSSALIPIPNTQTSGNSLPEAASTVYGYTTNAMFIDLPGQPGLAGPKFDLGLDQLNFGPPKMNASKTKAACGFKIMGTCIMRPLIEGFWESLILPIVKILLEIMMIVAKVIIDHILLYPISMFTSIFESGAEFLTKSESNPVVALAMMGVSFINGAMDTWLMVLLTTTLLSLIPGAAGILAMLMPFLFAWIALMLGIGFITAYYIPFLPYMIFTFGALAWLISVVEAMTAAPLVALGIAHPEGHDALGKSEQGLMILLNVFLRPAMMVIGFIASIGMCYVGVWLLNSGFNNVLGYLQGDEIWASATTGAVMSTGIPWAQLYGLFFGVLIYTMIYLTIVEKAFSLIAVLPDKVLRWIGGQQEGVGGEAMQWTGEAKGKVDKAGDKMDSAGGGMQKHMTAGGTKGMETVGEMKDKAKSLMSGSSVSAKGK